jgi:hypothetical protein
MSECENERMIEYEQLNRNQGTGISKLKIKNKKH